MNPFTFTGEEEALKNYVLLGPSLSYFTIMQIQPVLHILDENCHKEIGQFNATYVLMWLLSIM